jgi:hypothetical protein
MLSDGFTDVPAGRIAAVVTHLEMLEPAALRPEHATDDLSLARIEAPTAAW